MNAYALYPDSLPFGTDDEDELIAVFEIEEHAHMFGEKMYGIFYTVEPIFSPHFKVKSIPNDSISTLWKKYFKL